MSNNRPLGYGRYKDDPGYVGCPRAKSDMTPCIARDGSTALSFEVCVGCGQKATALLRELQQEVHVREGSNRTAEVAANDLRALVREVTA